MSFRCCRASSTRVFAVYRKTTGSCARAAAAAAFCISRARSASNVSVERALAASCAEVAAQCAKWEAGGRAEGVGKAGGMRCASASLQARII